MKKCLIVLGVTFFSLTLGSYSQAYDSDYKVELSGIFGYTFSNGVNVNPVDIGAGQIVDKITPRSGASWGAGFDFLLSENLSAGFNWSQQKSELEGSIQSGGKESFTSLYVHNFHGIFTYTFGEEDSGFRPFIFGGLGATHYRPGSIQGNPSDTSTRFSTTWGFGGKAFISDHLGFKIVGRWTPTYINSEASGIWCNPWWPSQCWVLGNPQYSHQFELAAGVIIRF
jgi:hypothetical protein